MKLSTRALLVGVAVRVGLAPWGDAAVTAAATVPGCNATLAGLPAPHEFRDIAIQPDGKIVAAGYWDTGGSTRRDFLLARFHPDLSLDTSFNAPLGYVTDDLFGNDDEIYAVAIQPDQKIVVAGYTSDGGTRRMGFGRYDKDGALDPVWGLFWMTYGQPPEEIRDLLIQPDGKIVAVGYWSPGAARVMVLRMLKDGNFDPAFTGGIPTLPGSTTDIATGVALQPDGKIVLSATARFASDDFTAVRLDTVGDLDPTFNTTGVSSFTAANIDTTHAVLRQPDGKIVVAGTSNNDLVAVRFMPNGPIDTGFGASGRVVHDFFGAGSTDAGYDVTLDAAGKIVIAGETSFNLAVARFLPTGGLDAQFASDPSGLADRAYAVQITEAGKILLGGSTGGGPGRVASLALFNPDGTQTCPPPLYPVSVFTASASGDAANGRVMLNWLNPDHGLYDETIIREVPGCPAGPIDGTFLVARNDGLGQPGGYTHTFTVPHGTRYYAAFVEDAANNPSPVTCVEATTFDSTARNTEWIYGTGISSMTTPGLRVNSSASESVAYTIGNDGLVHAIFGGSVGVGGGAWPAIWKPFRLGGGAPDRPLILPLPPTNQLALVTGSEDGHVYALDAITGDLLWRSPQLGGTIAASPGAVLTLFGGLEDYIFIGTRDIAQPNRFYALNAEDGTVAWSFDNGGPPLDIGPIVSAPTVDYTNHRVFFTSHGGGSGLAIWCLRYSGSTPTACTSWGTPGQATPSLGDVETSPIRYKSYLYVSDAVTGELLIVDPATGSSLPTFPLTAPGANGYVFPRFNLDSVFVSDFDTVWSLDTSTTSASPLWLHSSSPLMAPSTPLHVPGTSHVYVGTGQGQLLHYDAALGGPTSSECIGDCSTVAVGGPAYDVFRNMIYLGTSGGEVYGVRAPF